MTWTEKSIQCGLGVVFCWCGGVLLVWCFVGVVLSCWCGGVV